MTLIRWFRPAGLPTFGFAGGCPARSPAILQEVDIPDTTSVVLVEKIEKRIYLIRGHKVMLDSDLAELYEVPTFRFNEQVRRNIHRFPEDFMFQLTEAENSSLRSQNAILKKSGRGQHRKYLPLVFTD